jgi:hypothetical protein
VQPQKTEKIDLNTEYICPCRRRGRLVPITLTEAFGCDRCQQIFVVEDNGYILEQLSTTYPYKRAWRWMGNSWQIIHPRLEGNYLPITLGALVMIFVLVIIWPTLRFTNGSSLLAWGMIILLLVILLVLIGWLTHRR